MFEQIQMDFMDIDRSNGQIRVVDKNIKVSRKDVDNIIEMLDIQVKQLSKMVNTIENIKSKFYINYKIKELQKLHDLLVEETGYCKECKSHNKEDVGLDAIEAALNGYK